MNIITDNLDPIIDAPDGIKRLRELILQLAVQGKLVPQRPEEGTADELLQQIKEAKRKDAEERKARGERVRKAKPLPPISEDEIPYEISKGWKWVPLEQIANVGTGATPLVSNNAYYGGENNWVSSKSTNTEFITEPDKFITDKALQETNCTVNPAGTLVVAMYGQGKTRGQVSELKIEAATNQACASVSLILSEPTIRQYVKILFKKLYNEIRELASGGAQPNLNLSKIKETAVPLPPLAEQKRIVAKVDELMAWCDSLDALKQKRDTLQRAALKSSLVDFCDSCGQSSSSRVFDNFAALVRDPADVKQLRDAILQLAVQGRLVPQRGEDGTADELLKQIKEAKRKDAEECKTRGERIRKAKTLPPIKKGEIPFDIPKDWKWVRLDDVSSYIQRGKSPKYSDINEVPVIAQKCVQWRGFELFKAKFINPETLSSYAEERFVRDGDLLWNSTGLGTLGRIIIFRDHFKEQYPKIVADSHVTVIRPLQSHMKSDFIFALLAGAMVQSEIENMSSGSTKQMELATSTVKSHLIPIPPLAEQQRIVKKVDELMVWCDELETLLQTQQETATRFAAAIAQQGSD